MLLLPPGLNINHNGFVYYFCFCSFVFIAIMTTRRVSLMRCFDLYQILWYLYEFRVKFKENLEKKGTYW